MVRGLLRGLLLSASPDKRDAVLRQLEKRAREAQHELASYTDAGDDVLDFLAREGAPATRRAVAANIATPAQTNRHLAEDAHALVHMLDRYRLTCLRRCAGGSLRLTGQGRHPSNRFVR